MEAYHYRGSAYVGRGDNALAIMVISTGRLNSTASSRTHTTCGVSLTVTRAISAVAISNYDEAIRLNPEDEHYYNSRGHSALLRGKLQRYVRGLR